MQWMLLPFRRYFDFRGRSRRLEFWMFQLLNVTVAVLLIVPAVLLADNEAGSRMDSNGPGFSASAEINADIADNPVSLALMLLYAAYALAALIPSFAVTWRRFHDRDMSGWWYPGLIVLQIIPLLGFLASIALFVLLVLPGTNGPNRFGRNPKNPESEAAVFE